MCAAAQAGAVADAGLVGTKSSALSQPRSVRPSWKAELRQAGTNALEEAERKLVLWDLGSLRIPPCFHASMLLTSHALIGRPHALRGITYHALPAPSVAWRGRDLATTALRWSRYRTGKTACRRDQCRRHVRSGSAFRFEGPGGGTEEFLGGTAAGPTVSPEVKLQSDRGAEAKASWLSPDMCLVPLLAQR